VEYHALLLFCCSSRNKLNLQYIELGTAGSAMVKGYEIKEKEKDLRKDELQASTGNHPPTPVKDSVIGRHCMSQLEFSQS